MIGPRKIRHSSHPREGAPLAVVLGGIGPNPGLPGRMGKALHAAGYAVETIHYPSTRYRISELVADHLRPALARINTDLARPLNVVTFSMGGIIFRELMRTAPPENFARAVLVAPPNNGSEVAQFLKGWWPYRWMFGPGGRGACARRGRFHAEATRPAAGGGGGDRRDAFARPVVWLAFPPSARR